jgi:hypothetical protein
MYAPTGKDTNYLFHEPRTINRFADLKTALFLNSPLYSIYSVINTCAVRFLNENITVNSCLSVLRPLT